MPTKFRDINDEIPPQDGTGLATLSLTFGVFALLLFCFWQAAVSFAAIGAILGVVAILTKLPGRGIAITGLICSTVAAAIALVLPLLW